MLLKILNFIYSILQGLHLKFLNFETASMRESRKEAEYERDFMYLDYIYLVCDNWPEPDNGGAVLAIGAGVIHDDGIGVETSVSDAVGDGAGVGDSDSGEAGVEDSAGVCDGICDGVGDGVHDSVGDCVGDSEGVGVGDGGAGGGTGAGSDAVGEGDGAGVGDADSVGAGIGDGAGFGDGVKAGVDDGACDLVGCCVGANAKCSHHYYDDGFDDQLCKECESTCLECLD